MGNKLLKTDIAGIVNKSLGSGLLPGRITQETAGTRTTGSLAAGTNPTSKTSEFRGFFENLASKYIDGTRVVYGDSAVFMLGDSLAPNFEPGAGDTIVLNNRTVEVVVILETDPDRAGILMATRG